MPMPPLPWALLAADTDRTQDYVLESSRLPEIRGASRLVDDAIQTAKEWVEEEGGSVIFSGGGNLLACVTQEKADRLTRKIENYFCERTKTATITAAWRPLAPEWLEHGGIANTPAPFGSVMDWAGLWLRRAKDQRDQTPWVEALPFVERCRSCQVRPADPYLTHTYPDWPLCGVCHHKRSYIGRYAWFQNFQDYLEQSGSQSAYYASTPPFEPYTRFSSGPRPSPQDLSEIGQACRARPGYIGLIYLDGDGFGSVFARLQTMQQASQLSEAIRTGAQQAVMGALAACLHPAAVIPSDARQGSEEACNLAQLPNGRLPIHPFEILTIGGDDVILIVPADQAIPIACHISQIFQNLVMAQLAEQDFPAGLFAKPLTLSGGVVIASDHNPVRILHTLSGELKASAKKARKLASASEGYLDFAMLMGAEMPARKLSQVRKLRPYTLEIASQRPLSLLARPYPVSRLLQAWAHLQTLKGEFSTSQMSQMAEKLLRGLQESRLHYQYQRQRIGKYRELDAALEALLGREEGLLPAFPWFEFEQKQTTQFRGHTALWDVAELYPFVPAP